MRYNNYHKHTHMSNISTPDSIIKPEDIAKHAKFLDHTILSTVEHGYGGNILEYYDTATENGLNFIFGTEMYFVLNRFEKDKTNTHIILLAKSHYGMRQINKLISESSKTGFYYKNRVDLELLFTLDPSEVVITTACVGSYIGLPNVDYIINFVKPLQSHFGENFYLEIQDNIHSIQIEYNKKILELSNQFGIEIIHGADSHYLLLQDAQDRKIFLKGKNIGYDDEEDFILDYPDYNTILKRYKKQGVITEQQAIQALKNTLIIDDFEKIKLDKTSVKMPHVCSQNESPNSVLKEIINEEWKKERKEILKEKHLTYIERIRYEMDIVEKTDMAEYFILNYKIIKRAKELGGILTKTGRGSAPSFYINKLLGFTEIDALDTPITLYPTRFMSVSRILETGSLADIDYNTANPELFLQASREILGEDSVHWMIAYGTMKESEAFRNLCRSKDLKIEKYNEVAKNLEFYKNDSKWKNLIEESKKFVGVIDSAAVHPCAVLIWDKPISEEFGLFKTKENLCAIVDSYKSDVWKYLKNDYLTVTVWQIISETYKLIGKSIPNIRELTSLIDDKVWNLYEKGLTITLNQTGTESGIAQITQYKPKNIRELCGWVSAIRPSFESMKEVFLNRQKFSYGIEEFDNLLTESDNFVLYQENIMTALIYAGFPEDETYGLLKAIAKKKTGIIEPIKKRFMEGFIKKTNSPENAEKVWKIIKDAVFYGFNSSHAFCVALDSLYGAYLKTNYSLEYYTVILNLYENNINMTSKIYKELPYFNIKVTPIKFGKSQADYTMDKENYNIVQGLTAIKHLNDKIAQDLYDLSQQKQYNIFLDLLIDIKEQTSVNSKQLEILITLNFFDAFAQNQKLLKFTELFSKLHNKKQLKKDKIIQLNLNHDIIKQYTRETDKSYVDFDSYNYLQHIWQQIPNKSISIQEQILQEKQYLGYAYSTKQDMPNEYYITLAIDTKYSPRTILYSIQNGTEHTYKIQKKLYFNQQKEPSFNVGDMVKIKKTEWKAKRKLVDKEWTEDPSVQEEWLTMWSVIIPKERGEQN